MESSRWLVLILLSTAFVGIVAHMWILGRRLARLKEILDRAPKDAAATPGAPKLLDAPPEKPKPGRAFGDDVEWSEASIETQRTAASGPPSSTASGATMLDRAALGDSASSPGPGAGGVPRPQEDGDLLRKLLSFDKSPEAVQSQPGAAPPPSEKQEAASGARPPELFAGIDLSPMPAAQPGSKLILPVLAPKPVSSAPAAGSPEALQRLGAFAAPEVGAPASVKAKPAEAPRQAPAFSLDLGRKLAPGKPEGRAAEEPALLGGSPLDRLSPGSKPGGAPPVSSTRDRGIPVGDVFTGLKLAAGRTAQIYGLATATPQPSPEPEPASPDEAASSGRSEPSFLGRLGAAASPGPALPELPPKPASSRSPLGSLMNRLGAPSPVAKPAAAGTAPAASPLVRLGAPRSPAVEPEGVAGLMARLRPSEREAEPVAGGPEPVASLAHLPAVGPADPFQALSKLMRKGAVPTDQAPLDRLAAVSRGRAPEGGPAREAPKGESSGPLASGTALDASSSDAGPRRAFSLRKPRDEHPTQSPMRLSMRREGVPSGPAAGAASPTDLASLEAAFVANPQDRETHRALAQAYLSADRTDFAIEALEELTAGEEASDADFYFLGLALAKAGRDQDARRALAVLSERFKGSPWAGKAIGLMLKLKASQGAPGGPPPVARKPRLSFQLHSSPKV